MRNFGNNLKNWYGSLSMIPAAANSGIYINSQAAGNASNVDLYIQRPGSTANALEQGPCILLKDTTNNTNSVIQQSGGQLEFWNWSGSLTQAAYFASNNGLVIGAPTGGSQGSGTINATGLYINGVAVSGSSGSVDSVLSSNFIVNNSSTLAASGLSVTMPSTGYYQFEATLLTNAVTSAAGARFQLTGGTATISTVQNLLESGSVNGVSVTPQAVNMVSSAAILTSVGTSGADVLIIKGTINCTATGTVILEFAQYAATTSNTSLVAGSFIKFSKL